MLNLDPNYLQQSLVSLVVSGSIKAGILLVVFIIAYIVYIIIKGLVKKLFESFEIEKHMEKLGLDDALFGFTAFDVTNFIIGLYILILSIAISGDIAGIIVLEDWGVGLLDYFPKFLQGLLVLLAGFYLGDFFGDKVRKSEISFAGLIGGALQFFIIYIALVMALPAIFPAINVKLLEDVFILVVAALALGFGLAIGLSLGLGSKDTVEQVIKQNKKKIKELI